MANVADADGDHVWRYEIDRGNGTEESLHGMG